MPFTQKKLAYIPLAVLLAFKFMINAMEIKLSAKKKANAQLSPTVSASFSDSFVEPPGPERKTNL